MRRLLILRHAKSSWDRPDRPDRERPLDPRGERAAAAMGVYLAQHGRAPDLVLCSAALRARQTLDGVRPHLPDAVPVHEEVGLYAADADDLLERLRALPDDVGCALLIGHNPSLHELAVALMDDATSDAANRLRRKLPTAGLVTLELREAGWAALGPGRAALADFATPKDLV